MSYWQDRIAQSQTKLTAKSLKQIQQQMRRYYSLAMTRTLEDFESTYNKLLATIEDGKQPTPADRYKLDKYWQMQGQLRKELQKLGERQVTALSKIFEINFFDVYYSIGIEGAQAFNTITPEGATQLINAIWVADGKSWSQRIWDNTNKLADTLNEELINCVVRGKKTSELKKVLQERFNVSYNSADSLARTELAHVQTEAAKKRYEDYGVQQVQIWADPDERTCEVCGELHKKIYPVGAHVPIPAHPRCRCCIIPVVEK